MQTITIEQKTANIINAKEITTDILQQKFIEAVLELDATIVEPFIPEDIQFRDFDKHKLVEYLHRLFRIIKHKHPEDYRVEKSNLLCGICKYKKPLAGFEVYTGVELKPYYRFAFYIETDAFGNTTEIIACHDFYDEEEGNDHICAF